MVYSAVKRNIGDLSTVMHVSAQHSCHHFSNVMRRFSVQNSFPERSVVFRRYTTTSPTEAEHQFVREGHVRDHLFRSSISDTTILFRPNVRVTYLQTADRHRSLPVRDRCDNVDYLLTRETHFEKVSRYQLTSAAKHYHTQQWACL